MKPRALNRIALLLAIVGIVFTIPAVAVQIGVIPYKPVWFILSVVVVNILWCGALCCLSKARGYHPLWGLTLLFPPMIIIYAMVFPDKNKASA